MHRLVSTLCAVTLVTTLAGCLGDDPDTANGLNGLRPHKPGSPDTITSGPVHTVGKLDSALPLVLFNPDGVKLAVGEYSTQVDDPAGTAGKLTIMHSLIEAEPGVFLDTMTVYGQSAELCQIIARRYDVMSTIEFHTCEWLNK